MSDETVRRDAEAGGTGAMRRWSRRAFVAAAPLALAGCAVGARVDRWDYSGDARGGRLTRRSNGVGIGFPSGYADIYGEIDDGRFVVDPLDFSEVDADYLRAIVPYRGPERPGTIVIDTAEKYLYLVRDDGEAIRYGVGVGREGFGWTGRATIKRKAEWPTWTPPREMTLRDEEAAKWAGGMPGGPDNPLGARAMYLYQGDRDTLYRIHGNNDPSSIGHAVSSGCIRLLNHDVIDLYRRTPVGTTVVVLG
ncbi:MAG: L,D-transpeptidase [Hyphomicrobiales bacterium]|nr:L,D-transpeptidase [Hyphomicrobiales bacterium]